MRDTPTRTPSSDAGLWALALVLSLCLNLILVAGIGLATIHAEKLRPKPEPTAMPLETVATIIAVMPDPASVKSATPAPPRFARTSEDQTSQAPEQPAYIGERDTRATSANTPDANAPDLPAQSGENRPEDETPETTESDYQDGTLRPQPPASPTAETLATESARVPALPAPEASVAPAANPAEASPPSDASAAPAQAASLPQPAIAPPPAIPPRPDAMQGPNPVDVPVPKPADPTPPQPPPVQESPPSPQPEIPPAGATRPAEASTPPVSRPSDPAFSGNQRKSAITGSISRTGRSALDVVDSPLGRYQAVVGRAVEQEWQRNCVRHRDFITPGFLTVRFYVGSDGKVRSVMFDGEMQTGEIQKGFTLNSIREADIPPMPPALRKQFSKEPLELVFRFYF